MTGEQKPKYVEEKTTENLKYTNIDRQCHRLIPNQSHLPEHFFFSLYTNFMHIFVVIYSIFCVKGSILKPTLALSCWQQLLKYTEVYFMYISISSSYFKGCLVYAETLLDFGVWSPVLPLPEIIWSTTVRPHTSPSIWKPRGVGNDGEGESLCLCGGGEGLFPLCT